MATSGGGSGGGGLGGSLRSIYNWLGNPKNAMALTTLFDRIVLQPGYVAEQPLKLLAGLAAEAAAGARLRPPVSTASCFRS